MKILINSPSFGVVAALLAALCWSVAVIIFKSASRFLSPLLIVLLKNTIATLCFVVLFFIFDIPFWLSGLESLDYYKIIISGVLGMGIADLLFIKALSQIGANRVAIVNCFEPGVVYLFSVLMLGSFLTPKQLFGFLVVVVALLIISYEKDDIEIASSIKRRGVLTQVLAVVLSSFGIVLIKPVLSKLNASIASQLWVTFFRLFPGFIFTWIVFMFKKNKLKLLIPLKNKSICLKIIIASGLGTFLALSFWIIGYTNIQKPPVASILGQTSVLFIIVLSYFFLNEKISKTKLGAMSLAICGVLFIVLN
jgi:drug/metabolite transporter (DMT)-like permease